MQFSANSWRFRQADSQLLHIALFVRDVARLAIESSARIPPPLTWDVAGHGDVVDASQRAAAASQWTEWWGQLLTFTVDDAKRTDEERGYEVMERLRLMSERQNRAFDPPEFRSLASTPELQNVVIATFGAGLEWYNRSRPNTHQATAGESFSWEGIRDAAESVAAERGVTIGALRAVVHVLDVEGQWRYLAAPGHALCSTSLAADSNAAALLLHDAFDSTS